MRLFFATLFALTSVVAMVGCKSEPEATTGTTNDMPPANNAAPGQAAPATTGTAPGGQPLPPGVEAKDVPGMGAPPPAGSDAANQPPASGAIRQ